MTDIELKPIIDLRDKSKDEYLIELGNYEIEVRDGKTYAVRKKLVYPNNYEDCCEVLGIDTCVGITGNVYSAGLISLFVKLKICRDAYWKIAGEGMGLDKPWKPDWCNEKIKYCLVDVPIYGGICKRQCEAKHVLAFPTGEMRDAFYENFKDLIERCKELL